MNKRRTKKALKHQTLMRKCPKLTPYDLDFAEQMETARALMKKRRNALRALAQ